MVLSLIFPDRSDTTTSAMRPGWTGQVGNNVLDPGALRGWRQELSIDSQREIGSASEGVLDLDALSCVGPVDEYGRALLSASFRRGGPPLPCRNSRTGLPWSSNGFWLRGQACNA